MSTRTFQEPCLHTFPYNLGAIEPKEKHRMTSSSDAANMVLELFNEQNKNEIDDAIGKFLFVNGFLFNVVILVIRSF